MLIKFDSLYRLLCVTIRSAIRVAICITVRGPIRIAIRAAILLQGRVHHIKGLESSRNCANTTDEQYYDHRSAPFLAIGG